MLGVKSKHSVNKGSAHDKRDSSKKAGAPLPVCCHKLSNLDLGTALRSYIKANYSEADANSVSERIDDVNTNISPFFTFHVCLSKHQVGLDIPPT